MVVAGAAGTAVTTNVATAVATASAVALNVAATAVGSFSGLSALTVNVLSTSPFLSAPLVLYPKT